MTTEQEAWLALTNEETIEPALPICDRHHKNHLPERCSMIARRSPSV